MAAAAGGLHVRGDGAGHLEGADDVHGVDALEVIGGEAIEVRVVDEVGCAGVIDEAIDAAPFVHGGGDHAAAVIVLRDIGLAEEGLDAELFAFGEGFAGFDSLLV